MYNLNDITKCEITDFLYLNHQLTRIQRVLHRKKCCCYINDAYCHNPPIIHEWFVIIHHDWLLDRHHKRSKKTADIWNINVTVTLHVVWHITLALDYYHTWIKEPVTAIRALSQYKDRLSQVWDSHVKDKTVVRPSYFWHGNPYTGKMVSLNWDGPQGRLRSA